MHYVLNGKRMSAYELSDESCRLNYFDRDELISIGSMREIEDMFVEFGHKLLKVNDNGTYEILHKEHGTPTKLFLK